MKKQKINIMNCQGNKCKKLCEKMKKIRKQYSGTGGILVPPFDNFGINENKMEIQYDLLNARYIPSEKYNYTEEERKIIENHIKLFHLNSSERRNREVALYCKNVIDQESLLTGIRYNNYIVDLFREKLEKLDNISKAIEICKIIYFMNFIKMAT